MTNCEAEDHRREHAQDDRDAHAGPDQPYHCLGVGCFAHHSGQEPRTRTKADLAPGRATRGQHQVVEVFQQKLGAFLWTFTEDHGRRG